MKATFGLELVALLAARHGIPIESQRADEFEIDFDGSNPTVGFCVCGTEIAFGAVPWNREKAAPADHIIIYEDWTMPNDCDEAVCKTPAELDAWMIAFKERGLKWSAPEDTESEDSPTP